MFTGLELTTCTDLAVPAQVMQHVVQVESHGNPYAIGVVGARLLRQPRDLDEALATVHMLDAGNHDYSLGAAQVHRANLESQGLATYRQAFAPCANVAAGARILANCYARYGRDWGKAFSCYYSGNPVTGFRDGYVQKVYAALPHDAGAIAATPTPGVRKPLPAARPAPTRPPAPGDRAWRLAIRSAPVDQINNTDPGSAPAATGSGPLEHAAAPAVGPYPDTDSGHVGEHAGRTSPAGDQAAADAFVPQVRGPRDPAPASDHRGPPPPLHPATGAGTAATPGEHRDAAFVF